VERSGEPVLAPQPAGELFGSPESQPEGRQGEDRCPGPCPSPPAASAGWHSWLVYYKCSPLQCGSALMFTFRSSRWYRWLICLFGIVPSSCLELFLYVCVCHGYCILKISSASFPVWRKAYCVSAEKHHNCIGGFSLSPLCPALPPVTFD